MVSDASGPGIVIGFLCFILVLGLWVVTRERGRRAQIRLKRQRAYVQYIIDRFGASEAFDHFMQSPEGQKFLDRLAPEEPATSERTLHLVQKGCLFIPPGLLLSLIGLFENILFLYLIGLVTLLMGAGFGVSALVVHRFFPSSGTTSQGGPYA
jgi:hypothetical protein